MIFKYLTPFYSVNVNFLLNILGLPFARMDLIPNFAASKGRKWFRSSAGRALHF